ncbi:MAG: TetR/AcrR family transcriptional regulator [Intrasporangium sp.]|uniref:TetR/AcrR family transcriptional regulator n=1 Tax=Intrasporangium sp. TaxID=1925024 RepID=UPI00264731C9|nr:TetR/AcrR family transcriptional regulator [Intrasporangium sp.]MDN5794768.1 TetR/AcrR family transcriptional regulator [Intrasporangium sp.]
MSTVTEPKQDRSRLTRQRILEATVQSLASRGWEASSVAVIAADAGTSRGALQHHFPTREDLIVAALDFMFEKRSELVRTVTVPDLTGTERVAHVLHTIIEVYVGTLFGAALQVWTAAAADEVLRDRIVPLERKFGSGVHAMTIRLLGVDDTDPHVRTLIQATLDMIRGLALADLLTDDSRRRRRVVGAWAQQLSEGLGLTE